MAKVTLGQRPKHFKKPVSFPMLDGTEGVIECVFKYRTKTEFGEFLDRLFAAAGLDATAGEPSMAAAMARTVDKNADYLLEVLESWDLPEGLSRATLTQLADEVPAAAAAIMDSYRQAVVEGRLGNSPT